MPVLQPDAIAPDFTLHAADGSVTTLSRASAAGPVLLAFYKTECPTCALAFPFVERIHEAYAARGLQVLGIAQNDAESAAAYAQERGATFPQVSDEPLYLTSGAYGIDFTPTLVLVDGNRKVRAAVEAWQREGYNALCRRIADMLGADFQPISAEGDGAPPMRPG